MNIEPTLHHLHRTLAELAPDLPFYALYASGEHITGRALWNSPLVLTMLIKQEHRFGQRANLGHFVGGLQKTLKATLPNARLHLQTAFLGHQEGHFVITQQNRGIRWGALAQHQFITGVVKGICVYHNQHYPRPTAESDLRQIYRDAGKERRDTTLLTLTSAYQGYHLPPRQTLPALPLDMYWVAQVLAFLEEKIKTYQGLSDLSLEDFLGNLRQYTYVRWTARELSSRVSDLGGYLISRLTGATPYNYTQLAEDMAAMDWLPFADVESLKVILERPHLGPPVLNDENVEGYLLLTEHGHSVTHLHEGVTRYLHRHAE